jgi:type III pantothenate kinase
MKLVIDIGNTNVKCAVFEKSNMVKSFIAQNLSDHAAANFLSGYGMLRNALIANVRSSAMSERYIAIVKKRVENVAILSENTPLPIRNGYKTPKTLGVDRLAAAVGANTLYYHQNILIINIGTALVFDWINGGEYYGGNISLGLKMRYKALNKFTNNLPLCAPALNVPDFGQTTDNAIIAGVQNGMLHEIIGTIRFFEKKYGIEKTILTGGDADILAVQLPNVEVIPNLTLFGLNEILEYQIKLNSRNN